MIHYFQQVLFQQWSLYSVTTLRLPFEDDFWGYFFAAKNSHSLQY
jgi:hypothetical protein